MIRGRALVMAAALVLAGCGYTEVHEVVLRAPSGQTGRPVEIYMYGQPPPRAFYEVALLQVVGHGADANLADLVKALTLRAGQLGCDAVLRVQIDQGYSLAHAFGVCARWVEGAAPIARPPLVPEGAPAPAPLPLTPAPEPPASRAPVTPGGTSL
jgi:hypothetical protein